MMNRWIPGVLMAELAVHMVLMIVSLVLFSAGYPVNNVLSAEGIRWAFLHCITNVRQDLLIYLLAFFMMKGAFRSSGLDQALYGLIAGSHHVPFSFRQRRALWIVLILFLLFTVSLLLLFLLPQGVLVSVTGNFFPSAYSSGMVVTVMLALSLISIVYGVISNTLRTLREIVHAAYAGIGDDAGWVLVYMLGMQTYACFLYIFNNFSV